MRKIIKLSSFFIVVFSIQALPVMSYSPYLDQAVRIYNTRARCEMCHFGTSLNVFGADYQKSLLNNNNNLIKAFTSIENSDSDKDGYTNRQEIESQTLPGDKVSFPVASIEMDILRKSH